MPGFAPPVGGWLDVPITRAQRSWLHEIKYSTLAVPPGAKAWTCATSGKSLLIVTTREAGSQAPMESTSLWASERTLTKSSGASLSTCSTEPEAAVATTLLAKASRRFRSARAVQGYSRPSIAPKRPRVPPRKRRTLCRPCGHQRLSRTEPSLQYRLLKRPRHRMRWRRGQERDGGKGGGEAGTFENGGLHGGLSRVLCREAITQAFPCVIARDHL